MCFLWLPSSFHCGSFFFLAFLPSFARVPSQAHSSFLILNLRLHPSSFLLLLFSFLCGSLFRADLAGETLVFPPAALSDLAKLGPDRIEVRWKPRSIPDGYFPVVEGYYVVYNHENLSLFFGPVPYEKDAIRIQNELTKIRSDLKRKNPALSSSTVGRIHINFGEDPPVSQNMPPPTGLKPVRVYSGNSTLELGQANEGAELESPTTEGPTSSTYGITREPDNSEGIPVDESASAINGPPQGVENNESTPESPRSGSTAEEARNDPGESGILKILSQGAGPPKENPGPEGASSEIQSQTPQSPNGELAGTENPTSSAPHQTESSESGGSAGPSGQTQEPEIEPLRLRAEPTSENAPEAVAQSNAPTPTNPELGESGNLQKTKVDSFHINQLLKGNLEHDPNGA